MQLSEEETIDRLNTFLCILTSSINLFYCHYDEDELKMKIHSHNPRVDKIKIDSESISSFVQIDKTHFATLIPEVSLIVIIDLYKKEKFSTYAQEDTIYLNPSSEEGYFEAIGKKKKYIYNKKGDRIKIENYDSNIRENRIINFEFGSFYIKDESLYFKTGDVTNNITYLKTEKIFDIFCLYNKFYIFSNKNIYIYQDTNELDEIEFLKKEQNIRYIPCFCLNCDNRIPKLFIYNDDQIHINCQCQKEVSMKISEYITQFNLKKDRQYSFTRFSSIKIPRDEFQKRMKAAEEHLIYLTDLKNKICAQLNDTNKINELNEAYSRCFNMNKDVIKIAPLLFQYYKYDSIDLYYNIKRNSNFQIYKPLKENYNSALNYFNSFHFLKSKEYQVIYSHLEWVRDIIPLKDGRIATCSNDKTIKVFDPHNNYNCDIIILGFQQNPFGHKDKIFSIIQLDNGMLVSNSDDSTMKIWSITKNSYQYISTLNNEKGLVALSDDQFASINNNTIEFWNTTTSKPISTIYGGDSSYYRMFYVKNRNSLIAVAKTYYQLWSLKTRQLICTFCRNNCGASGDFCQIDEDRVMCSDSLSNSILMINLKKCNIETETKPEANSLIKLSDDIVLMGMKGHFRLYNIKTKELSRRGSPHGGYLKKVVKIDDETVVESTLEENTFRVWKF